MMFASPSDPTLSILSYYVLFHSAQSFISLLSEKTLAKNKPPWYNITADRGRNPLQKTQIRGSESKTKGAEPIEKNVIVIDEQGNEYEATYPKRANGLVKNGRARFVGDNKICLACPPDNFMEDNEMTDINEVNANKISGEVTENTAKTAEKTTAGSSKYTLDYALEQLEALRKESSEFAFETREKIGGIKSGGPGDVGAQAAGEALRALVQEQEQLYRRMFDFYTKIIFDLSPTLSIRVRDERQQFLDFVTDCVGANGPSVALPDFEKIWKMINA